MPFKNGIQVVQELRQFFKNTIDELELTIPGIKLKEPLFVFLTAHASPLFKTHLKAIGVDHCYEKPIQLYRLEEILKLIEQ